MCEIMRMCKCEYVSICDYDYAMVIYVLCNILGVNSNIYIYMSFHMAIYVWEL